MLLKPDYVAGLEYARDTQVHGSDVPCTGVQAHTYTSGHRTRAGTNCPDPFWFSRMGGSLTAP